MREEAQGISIKASSALVNGRERRSKQAEQQAQHPYGAEAEGEIGEHNGLVVLEDLAEHRVHGEEQETAAVMRAMVCARVNPAPSSKAPRARPSGTL